MIRRQSGADLMVDGDLGSDYDRRRPHHHNPCECHGVAGKHGLCGEFQSLYQ